MKKIVSLLLVVMLACACMSGFAIYDIPEAYDLPVSASRQLKVYMGTESGYEKAYLTYDEHVAILAWEEAVGLDFTFIHPPTNDDGTYFNTTIASGDLPDIMIGSQFNSYYAGGVEGAIQDKILIGLNDYIEQYGYYYLTEAHNNWDAQAEKNFMTDSGMYRFGAASQRVPVLGQQHSGLVIRQDVVDALDADIPETIVEFEELLIAAKEAGLVEVPIAFEKLDSSYYYENAQLTNWCGTISNGMTTDGEGNVVYAQTMPEYKEFLNMMIRWYQEGLFDEDCISRTHSDAEAMVTSGKSMVVSIGNWETQEDIAVGKAACGEDFSLTGLSTFSADGEDVVNHRAHPIMNGTNGMYWGITTTNPNPVESFKALDWLYSYEGTELMVFGPTEAVDQLHKDSGNVVTIHWTNEDGTRQFSDYMLKNEELEYNSIRYIYTIQNLSSEYASEMEFMQYGDPCNAQCWEAWTANCDNEWIVPSCISLTAEESQKQAPIKTDIEAFIWEKIYNIIFGTDSIDNWDSYVQAMYDMGLQDWIDIQQAATERYYAR